MDFYGSMSDTAKNERMTRFLMYKIAMRHEHLEFAAECLEVVSRSNSCGDVPDPTLLYACVLDAQQVGNKQQALKALQIVVKKFGNTTASTVHLPSLLRLTIKLSCSLLDATNGEQSSDIQEANIERICKLFEGGELRYHFLQNLKLTQDS